jgi:hypothetical protein
MQKKPINMKNHFTITLVFTLFCLSNSYSQTGIIINNNTGKRIAPLKYWIGSETESLKPNILYKERPALDSAQQNYNIPVTFHKKKRNSILIQAFLSGGGYVTSKYSIEKGETNAIIPLFNPSSNVPSDNFQTVVDKFKEFSFDRKYLQITKKNGLKSTLGGIIVVDETEKNILYNITPRELNSELKEICSHSNRDYANGTFSSKTSIEGNVSLPFVSINTAFSSGDVAKFKWTIENVGECRWAPEGDKDLATLFSELSPKTKNALIQTYKNNPKAKMKFINNAFIIGRIEIETTKSIKVDKVAELTGSSFVTAKGNYSLVDEFKSENVINDIITKVDGYYVTGLLANLYVLSLSDNKKKLTDKENQRVKNEFNYLLGLYPDELTATDDIGLIKKQVVALNKEKEGDVSYLKRKEGTAHIELDEVIKTSENIGKVKTSNEEEGN